MGLLYIGYVFLLEFRDKVPILGIILHFVGSGGLMRKVVKRFKKKARGKR